MNLENQIDLYVLGKLSKHEMEKFKQEILMDAELAVKVRKRELILSGLHALGTQNIKQRIQSVRSEMLADEEPNNVLNKKSRRISLNLWFAAAAMIACLFFAWQLFAPSSLTNEELFAKNYQPYSTNLNSRTSDDTKDILLIQKFYEEEKYQNVIPLLEKIAQEQPRNSDIAIMLGNSHLAIDQTEQAIEYFNSVIQRKDPLYADVANWYLALSYLKKNNQEQAKEILLQLTQDANADFYEEAESLLNDLD